MIYFSMIIILNGSLAVGKTSVALNLHERFEKSVMLDGDCIGEVRPFDLYDNARIEYLYDTLSSLISFHKQHGYSNFVINYVFETPESLASFVKRLELLDNAIFVFWLVCSQKEQEQRIKMRGKCNKHTRDIEWELKRAKQLNKILEKASCKGFIGERINTTGETVQEIGDAILKSCQLLA